VSESNLITGTDGLQFDSSKPQLAVHMQMALYPMTLTDFLSQDDISSPSSSSPAPAAPPLRHCYHLQPSIRILLAILDGIAYLHQNQIVHRDLKPGNIFMAPGTNSRLADGSVDLSLCHACSEKGAAGPMSLKVRIGDFGLVTALATSVARDDGKPVDEAADEACKSSSLPPVGTELYSPLDGVRGNASPALDIYAAGIVAVELLWPFGTRKLPPDFSVVRSLWDYSSCTVRCYLDAFSLPPKNVVCRWESEMRICSSVVCDVLWC
jgi:translation initiation factor 2-alpha kinase 3